MLGQRALQSCDLFRRSFWELLPKPHVQRAVSRAISTHLPLPSLSFPAIEELSSFCPRGYHEQFLSDLLDGRSFLNRLLTSGLNAWEVCLFSLPHIIRVHLCTSKDFHCFLNMLCPEVWERLQQSLDSCSVGRNICISPSPVPATSGFSESWRFDVNISILCMHIVMSISDFKIEKLPSTAVVYVE